MPNPREANPSTTFFRELADFQQILDALAKIPGTLFMIKDRQSRYVYMSSALVKAIHQRSPDDVIGKTDFDLFPKIIAESFQENDRIVFETGQPLIDEVHLTSFFSHEPRWSFSSKYPLTDRSGTVIGLVTLNETYETVMGKHEELNRLLPAIDHVYRNFANPLTVGELASLCHFSESHFMRLFKERLRLTAYAFVEQVRMYHAIELLKRGDESISRIAAACGFYDHSAFVKRFRKFTGKTPLRYRREHQAQRLSERESAFPQVRLGGRPLES